MNKESLLKTQVVNRMCLMFVLVAVLIIFTQDSYGQTITASTPEPLTEATLHGSVVTLSLSGGNYERSRFRIEDALTISGIDGVSVASFFGVERVSSTTVTVELEFSGNIDIDAVLTFTVEADAIADYNGNALTAMLPVVALEESLVASTEAPLTESILNGSVITLTLNGANYVRSSFDIRDAVTISGIDGVAIPWHQPDRENDTVITVELEFSGNIDTDATLTFTVGAGAIAGYNGSALTATLSVTAVEESLLASTAVPLTEATLDGSTITLTLTGLRFVGWSNEDTVSVSGIDGVTIVGYDSVDRASTTGVEIQLAFSGNIDTDATLTLTVGADAIGYDKAFTFEFPVTAVEESLEATAEAPLTEANLDGSTITLSINGRKIPDGFADEWTREDAVSVSGIDGVTLWGSWWDIDRVSDTQIAVKLEFDGTDFDADATLTFTMAARVANYSQNLTAQVPVTAIQQSNATVSIAPSPVESPDLGERLIFNLNIAGGENIAGYQAIVLFDDTALSLVDAANGDYLPAEAFFLADGPIGESSQIIYSLSNVSNGNSIEDYREVTLTANTLGGAGNGDGTLASLTFEVVDFKPSKVIPSQVYLVDVDGKRWEATTESAEVTMPPEPEELMFGDINRDGVVNIEDLAIVGGRLGQRGKNSADVNQDGLVDIVDIVLVASAFDAAAAAPALYPQALELITPVDVSQWLTQAQGSYLTDATFQRGVRFLEQLLTMLTPKDTLLLPNYPNPFNPETWIPYRLAEDAFVTLTIYCGDGQVVRTLNVGYQRAAFYESRSKAIHWDGKNEFGEQVGSGVYFYRLSAGGYSAIRKMLILK